MTAKSRQIRYQQSTTVSAGNIGTEILTSNSTHSQSNALHIASHGLDSLKTFLQPVEIQPPSLSGHYQLWQLRPLARCLAEDAAKIRIQALILGWITATRCTRGL